jgi:hypothetical protein
MKIKKFTQFISEEVSGTELVGPMGPAYGETRLQNKTVNQTHTTMVSAKADNPSSKNPLTSGLFFEDDYQEIYGQYLKSGGSQSDLTGDSSNDIEIMLNFLREK